MEHTDIGCKSISTRAARDMATIDETHDAARRSFVETANGHPEFPIQNLPFGIFSRTADEPRGGVAIGDQILDLGAAVGSGLFAGDAARAAQAASGSSLNAFLALGGEARRALRTRLCELLTLGCPERPKVEPHLHPAAACTMHMPARVGDYTDFFAGIHHATNAGKQLRPDNPLLPNYKYVPIGYHGRASSIGPSGVAVRRPHGQRKPPDADAPLFGPSQRLDYELELGIWIGPGNTLGQPISISQAEQHVAGYCLLNDWSARDVQAWEYQPLGPFLAKNFATTISAWVIVPEALAPFRVAQPPRREGDPKPLDYLFDERDQREGALDLELEVLLLTQSMREKGLPPHRVAVSNTRYLYWTVAQLIAHHTSGGCNLGAGDLFGSGTISGPTPEGFGSLLESTEGGRKPLDLPSGESRGFLDDGDEVIMRARARRAGFASIGFGECRARVLPARSE
jgi:fumarylacetoacetase